VRPPLAEPGELELAGVLDGRRAFIGPEQVVIDATNRCNNNCLGCWTRSPLLRDREPPSRWGQQELPLRSLLGLIDDLADLGTRRVRFTGGGEPLLHPQIDEVLAACKQRGLITCLTTNGTLLTPERARSFAALPLDELAVSLWAATPETYSRTHPNRTGRTYERIRAGLAELCAARRLRPRVTLSHVLVGINHVEVERMLDEALALGADALYLTLLDPVEGCTDGLLLGPEQARSLLGLLDRVAARVAALPAGRRLELENFEGLRRRVQQIVRAPQEAGRGAYDAAVIDETPCTVGWIFCRVLADGSVVPCCRGSDLPLGNVSAEPFRAIWASERYAEFRHRALTLSKRDPYFAPLRCGTTCDNLMHLEAVARRLRALSPEERERLEALAARCRAEEER